MTESTSWDVANSGIWTWAQSRRVEGLKVRECTVIQSRAGIEVGKFDKDGAYFLEDCEVMRDALEDPEQGKTDLYFRQVSMT